MILILAALWIAAIVRAVLALRHPTASSKSLAAAISMLAAGITVLLFHGPVDSFTGILNLAHVVEHVLVLGAACSTIEFMKTLSKKGPGGKESRAVRIAIGFAVALAVTGFWLISPRFEAGFYDEPPADLAFMAYTVVFDTYMIVCLVLVAGVAAEHAVHIKETGQRWFRFTAQEASSALIACGAVITAIAAAAVVIEAISIAVFGEAEPIAHTLTELDLPGVAIIAAGLVLAALVRTVVIPVRQLRQLRRLTPLWTGLMSHFHGMILDPPKETRSPIKRLSRTLVRRQAETADFLMATRVPHDRSMTIINAGDPYLELAIYLKDRRTCNETTEGTPALKLVAIQEGADGELQTLLKISDLYRRYRPGFDGSSRCNSGHATLT